MTSYTGIDFWVPLSSKYQMDIPFDEAVAIVRAALQPLGQNTSPILTKRLPTAGLTFFRMDIKIPAIIALQATYPILIYTVELRRQPGVPCDFSS